MVDILHREVRYISGPSLFFQQNLQLSPALTLIIIEGLKRLDVYTDKLLFRPAQSFMYLELIIN